MEDCTDHAGAEAHEEVLEVSPGRGAHRLLGGARELGQAVHKCPVTLTQLVTTPASSTTVPHYKHVITIKGNYTMAKQGKRHIRQELKTNPISCISCISHSINITIV